MNKMYLTEWLHTCNHGDFTSENYEEKQKDDWVKKGSTNTTLPLQLWPRKYSEHVIKWSASSDVYARLHYRIRHQINSIYGAKRFALGAKIPSSVTWRSQKLQPNTHNRDAVREQKPWASSLMSSSLFSMRCKRENFSDVCDTKSSGLDRRRLGGIDLIWTTPDTSRRLLCGKLLCQTIDFKKYIWIPEKRHIG